MLVDECVLWRVVRVVRHHGWTQIFLSLSLLNFIIALTVIYRRLYHNKAALGISYQIKVDLRIVFNVLCLF